MFNFINELEKTISDEVQLYAEREYTPQLITAMLSKEVSLHISVPVDSMSLFESNVAFAHYMFQNPKRALKLLDDAFQKVSLNISRTHILKTDMVYKKNLHVRLIALPSLPEVYRSNLPNCSDVGQFLCISGTVVRASTAKMLQYKKLWRCSKCKYQFIIEAEVEQGYVCEKPLECKNPEFCNGKNFTLMSTDINTEWCKDYQEIKLQEQVYNLNVGTVPRSMYVILEDDLVETCHPGNDVIISGILIQQWKPLIKSCPNSIELVIIAHNIEVQNKLSSGGVSKDMAEEFKQFWLEYKSDPLSGRNFILSSICPQVFGLYIVKLAVALVLAGGVQKRSGSSRIRGDSHLLLIGDPGTAKSQFLKFATKVSPRSVLTSGIGTTNAGLTVSAVKESGRWELEAGALVLADGGICCIDEFSCIKEQDKTCIHEAMEQQTISVAKAGLVCSLNTRCSILAATNPKGRYDENLSISENTALGTPLLSRFDIILVLLDTYDENWDNMVASYILDGRNITSKIKKSSKLWNISKMKSYFTLIHHIEPKLSLDAERVLRLYYAKQRSLHSRNASRTTPRLLQSLIRLAEGHARLMFRTEVLVIDAVIAIILIESSMLGSSVLEGLSPLHTVFPENPAIKYVEEAERVIQNLHTDLPIDECYKNYYEERTLQNLLRDISSVWNSKDNPYIFGSTPANFSSSTEYFPGNDVDASKTGVSETLTMFEDTEDSFHKNDQGSSTKNPFFTREHEVVEAHRRNSYSLGCSNIMSEQVSYFPEVRENTVHVIPSSENSNESNFLNELTEKSKHEKCTDAISKNTNAFPFLKQMNLNETDENIRLNNMNENLQDSIGLEKKVANSCFERSKIDILEELGISPEKEQRDSEINQPNTLTERSDTQPNKSDILSILSQKRSLADQLKKFAFSKCNPNSNRASVSGSTSKANVNINESETPALDAVRLGESSKSISSKYHESKISTLNKNSASDKTLDKYDCTSNSSSLLEVNNIVSASNSSQSIHPTDLADTSTKNEHPNLERGNTIIPEAKQNIETPVTSKRPVSDSLKKFVFSKSKKAKS